MRRLAACLLIATVAAGCSRSHTIAANGVQVRVPSGWRSVEPAGDLNVIDPVTVLVVGTRGVQPRSSQCQIAAYRIPRGGAVVVVVRWRTETSGGGRPVRSRAPLREIVVRRPSFECFSGAGGSAELSLGGHAFQVNVLVGGHTPRHRIEEALAVARSFDLARG
jgi:hypothetical protein